MRERSSGRGGGGGYGVYSVVANAEVMGNVREKYRNIASGWSPGPSSQNNLTSVIPNREFCDKIKMSASTAD